MTYNQPGNNGPRWLRWIAPHTWWVIFLVTIVPVVLLTAVALIILLLTIDVTNNATARIELVKTSLAVGAGTGGVVALVLASRRQWSNEQTARASEHDATERRITELYTKAAEQLGSDKAPVRLAGLYALERLAQGNHAQRQTIVNVLCAYLRMPYLPPGEPPTDDADETTATVYRERVQEREVRLTAQRLLADHLHPGRDANSWVLPFWENINLDLSGAALVDFDLSSCTILDAKFGGAQFSGHTRFDEVRFSGPASFEGAQFNGLAEFLETQFNDAARFRGAQFFNAAQFTRTQFSADAGFDTARFHGIAVFGGARFNSGAGFCGTEFNHDAKFGDAMFNGDAWFGELHYTDSSGTQAWGNVLGVARFGGDAWFGGARFNGRAGFGKVRFNGRAIFGNVRFDGPASFSEAQFVGPAAFKDAQFSSPGALDEAQFDVDLLNGEDLGQV